jgi:TetR/AcrR family transcriptional regulator, transcriptional repressor for nem operon
MPMPRPYTFHHDAVLDQAMVLFWAQGYAQTSIQDIVDQTEVLRGSLYHTFGDKRALYIQVLQRYGQMAVHQLAEAWNANLSPRDNVRHVLMAIVDLPDGERQRGSLLCNAIVEVVPHEPEVAKTVEQITNACIQFFQVAFTQSQQRGAITPTQGHHARSYRILWR